MALRTLALGAAAGFGYGFSVSTVMAAEPAASADARKVSDGEEPKADPVRCVVVGGGYAGSRVAYQLDSVFQVTLIDTKNYFEASDELTSLLTGPEAEFSARLSDIHALHRFYLRRARVITNTVTDVTEDAVKLADGREVPYDVLVLATGETRPYPFAATAKTADVREAELRAYRRLLWRKDTCKVAIVGGGPKGCSLASCLTTAMPEKDVHLFHSTSTLAPGLPHEARDRISYNLENNPRVTVHRNAVVEDIRYTNQPSAAVDSLQKVSRWWAGWFGGAKKTVIPGGVVPDDLERQRAAATAANAAAAGASPSSVADSQNEQPSLAAESNSPYLGAKFDLDVSRRDSVEKQTPSVFYQAWHGDVPPAVVTRGEEIGRETHTGFDLVINCAGNRTNGRAFEQSAFLGTHLDAKGQFIVSKYLQLHGLPHIFSVGRSSGMNWTKSMGASDYQARALFRNLLSVANLADSAVANYVPTMSPVTRLSLHFPRLIVPFDEFQAVGSTAWSGSVTGVIALKELMQDRKYFLKEFHKPIFFKQQDDAKVRASYDKFFATAATDPTDFDL